MPVILNAEEQRVHDTMNVLAKVVANAMGVGWSVDPTDHEAFRWMCYLTFRGVRTLFLTESEKQKGKLSISYHMPHGTDWVVRDAAKNQTTSIKVAIDRGTDVIVREINRRLMPAVATLQALAAEQQAKAEAYETKMTGMMQKLHAALGQGKMADAEHQRNGDYTITTNCYRDKDTVDAEVKPCSDGEVDIKLSNLPFNAAIAILDFLRTYEGRLKTNP